MSPVADNEPSQQLAYVNTMQNGAALNDLEASDAPPNLPPVQLVSRKQSFVDMFTIGSAESSKRKSMGRPVTSPALGGASNTLVGTLEMSNVINRTASRAKSAIESPIHVTNNSVMTNDKQSSLRYTSSGSSTSRSKDSDESPSSSRPSSRSSVDEDLAVHHDLPKSISIVTDRRTSCTAALGAPLGRELGPRKSLRIKPSARSHTMPTRVSHRNKPLPPKPDDVMSELDLSPVEQFNSSLVYAVNPRPTKSKRGARLGRQMVGSFMLEVQNAKTEPLPGQRPPENNTTSIDTDQKDTAMTLQSEVSPKLPKECMFDSSTPERILLRIMFHVNNLDDLQSIAMVNRGFHGTFRRYEKELVSRTLFAYSLPAWELRQILKCEQKRGAFRLRSAQKDMATIRAMRSFILMKCESMCRLSTVEGLLGRDPKGVIDIENALWRTWIFCKLFGRNKAVDQNYSTQMLWLNGGQRRAKDEKTIALGVGNGAGLSVGELEDLSEVWSCLEALLSGFKNREAEARRAGVFDLCVVEEDSNVTETMLLNEWIYHILALGPKAVLTLVTCSFDQAKVLGITKWSPPEPGQTKATFFKAAIEHVYRERLVSEARLRAMEFERSIRARSIPQRAVSDSRVLPKPAISRTSLSVLTANEQPRASSMTTKKELRLSTSQVIRPDCDPLSKSQPHPSMNCSTPNTPVFSSLAIATGASARLGASLFPVKSVQQPLQEMNNQRQMQIASYVSTTSVIDPVDHAVHYLVEKRGCPLEFAQHALAMSDDGKGVDMAMAIEYIEQGPGIARRKVNQDPSELPGSVVPGVLPFSHATSCLPNRSRTLSANHYRRGSKSLGRATKRGSTQLGVIFDDEEEEDDHFLYVRRDNQDRHLSNSDEISLEYTSSPTYSPSLTPQPLRFGQKLRKNLRPHSSGGFIQKKSPKAQNSHFSAEYGMPGNILHRPSQRVSMTPKSTNVGLGMFFTNATDEKGIYRNPGRLWNIKENVKGIDTEKSESIGQAY